ncbi:hypothetical protein PsYK624_087020 [Phanerochaete sordida]|uniref:Uncharacterized protein n=1 Tax=Phanerochaete sordida TaxID=48140 RepID=A0A9P3LFZ5_9APHY|nr:hypothetical protein PsYK624_087020 [Phanerochaete sordida]
MHTLFQPIGTGALCTIFCAPQQPRDEPVSAAALRYNAATCLAFAPSTSTTEQKRHAFSFRFPAPACTLTWSTPATDETYVRRAAGLHRTSPTYGRQTRLTRPDARPAALTELASMASTGETRHVRRRRYEKGTRSKGTNAIALRVRGLTWAAPHVVWPSLPAPPMCLVMNLPLVHVADRIIHTILSGVQYLCGNCVAVWLGLASAKVGRRMAPIETL